MHKRGHFLYEDLRLGNPRKAPGPSRREEVNKDSEEEAWETVPLTAELLTPQHTILGVLVKLPTKLAVAYP